MPTTKPDTKTAHTPTPGPWFVSGVRFRMDGGEWHNVNRYDEALKRDENIACVGYDPRTGVGLADAHLIAAAPTFLAELKRFRLAYVNLLETGYDRIVALGGTCDPVDVMEAGDPAIRRVNEVIAKAEGRQS